MKLEGYFGSLLSLIGEMEFACNWGAWRGLNFFFVCSFVGLFFVLFFLSFLFLFFVVLLDLSIFLSVPDKLVVLKKQEKVKFSFFLDFVG